MRVKFWGVRGSIPVSSPKNSKYGGNTSCIELNCDEKTIIIDSGTGIRALGLDLEERDFVKENRKKDLYIFFSHFHWDHIQGFPYLYSSLHSDVDIENALSNQMIAPYFPIQLSDMSAKMNFNKIKSGEVVKIGKVVIKSVSLNHPGGSLGYKIICENRSIAYICDHEHTEKSKQRLVDFLMNTNQVIFDAHYTPEEYSGSDEGGGRKGWGHSTWMHGIELCREMDMKTQK
jgi:phosphoribosyl 1,2-cyclic phosphodiesterase